MASAPKKSVKSAKKPSANETLEEVAARVTPKKVKMTPLSQDDTKIIKDTAENCIAELRRIAEIDITKIVSRNFYRNHSKHAESAWSAHFGTFHEFKAAANITPTRAHFRLEKDIAKHASVDKQRLMNKEKANRHFTYLRPSNSRFQTILAGSDIHDIECDPFWRWTFLDTAKRVQPNKVVLNGDIFDLPEFGHYAVDPREWDVVGRIEWVHEFLQAIRVAAPNTEITFIEGNHEYRMLRHLTEQTQAMKTVLSDLHGFTVPKLLGLDQFEVNYVSKSDLATFNKGDFKKEVNKNFAIFYDSVLACHYPTAKTMSMPGFNGHHHSHLVWNFYNPMFDAYEWHQLGAGHVRNASYTNGEKWTNGFLLANVDTHTKRTQFQYQELRDFACIEGQWYHRDDTPEEHFYSKA